MPRFTPEFLDELKSRLRPSDVIGRTVSLKKQGNEFAGLSPFTKEKTPSFFVNDQKGFYHCFSSGRHGDIIKFLQETQNLSFFEAVQTLAQDAGLELPKDNPAEARRAEERKGLIEACAAAQAFFAATLTRAPGRAALSYVRGRAITDAQIAEFGIGFAPGARTALKDALINKGFAEDVLVEAGLLIRPDPADGRGTATYDKFRDRVMFPIKNPRGQVIAFGGRAMNPDARAKYMNSSETPLFHKGAVLYRYGEARTVSGSAKASLLVCEGYMDVVALWGAGFKTGVAPLGTALTEEQIALLWRVNDEPILCFDGDRAGRKAAFRAVERALPVLKPGKSLRFAFLPDGKDPDDLIKAEGRSAMDVVLADAKPFVDVLWLREQEAHDLTTPERRASFKANLRRLTKSIADPDVRQFYANELAARLDAAFGGGSGGGAMATGGTGRANGRGAARGRWIEDRKTGRLVRQPPPAMMSAELRAHQAAPRHQNSGAKRVAWQREATLCLALVNHPDLLDRRESQLFGLTLADLGLNRLLSDILGAFSTEPSLDSAGLKSHLQNKASGILLEQLLNDRALNSQAFLAADTLSDEVDWGFDTALSHHVFETNLKEELSRSASHLFPEENGSQTLSTDEDGAAPEQPSEPLEGSDHDPSYEQWRQTAAAREDLLNRHRASSRTSNDQDGDAQLEKALHRMKESVRKTSGQG
ncbi:MAG: DNA primase [Pseudomonadota bacterium]